MYRIVYPHPVSLKECSRIFKSLRSGYRFIRDYCSSMTFEVIPIGTSETFYVHYDLYDDVFIINNNDDEQFRKKITEIEG